MISRWIVRITIVWWYLTSRIPVFTKEQFVFPLPCYLEIIIACSSKTKLFTLLPPILARREEVFLYHWTITNLSLLLQNQGKLNRHLLAFPAVMRLVPLVWFSIEKNLRYSPWFNTVISRLVTQLIWKDIENIGHVLLPVSRWLRATLA